MLPIGAASTVADRLLADHAGWLRSKLNWANEVAARAERLGLLTPGLIWLDGRPYRAVTRGSPVNDGDPASTEPWYRQQAGTGLRSTTERAASRLIATGLIDRRPGGITIRDPRTRWGSYSSRGNLSYSWRLVMMPREVQEYVVCHELCHLRVPNHSQAFWQLMDAARPSWPAEMAWLRQYGPMIALHEPVSGAPNPQAPLPPALPAVTQPE